MPVFDNRIPDIQLPNGATTAGRRRPSCGSHAAHSDGADDHETLSASTSSDGDFVSQIFDMEGFERDFGTDVTTPSESSSEEQSPPTRPSVPTLVLPATASHDHEGDCDMPDAPSEDPPDPNLWPTLSGPQPPRDTIIRVDGSSPPSPPSDMPQPPSPSPDVPPPPPPEKKRTRELKSREETGKVRGIKACFLCRLNKTACDSNTICAPCAAMPHGEEICIRKSLGELIPPTADRWNWNEPYYRMPDQKPLAENSPTSLLSIFCSGNIQGPCLKIRVRPVPLPSPRNSGAQHSDFAFVSFDAPLEADSMYWWMVQQIMTDGSQDFETQMDKLLVHVVHGSGTNTGPGCQTPKNLLASLLRMRCMWRLWSCRQMFMQSHPGSPAAPLRYASIQDFLRLLAAREISVLERQILDQIEGHSGRSTKDLVVKWILLRQMLHTYRQSLDLTLGQEETNAAPISYPGMPQNERRRTFQQTTKQLFAAVVVIHYKVFYKQTMVKRVKNAGLKEVFEGNSTVFEAFQNVWQALPGFYTRVLGPVSTTDDKLFKAYIVEKEVEILDKLAVEERKEQGTRRKQVEGPSRRRSIRA